MKTRTKTIVSVIPFSVIMTCFCLSAFNCSAQDTTAAVSPPPAISPVEKVKNTFKGNLIIDNQTCMVPIPKTFEFTIQHRFGTFNNGYKDMYGIFAPANIRLGWNYTIIEKLQLGLGVTKEGMNWDGNVKYAITKQAVSLHGCPVSVTYYGNMACSTLPKAGNFVSDMDRWSYFNQLIFARKVTKSLSVQVSPSLSYFNNVEGYLSSENTIKPKMNNTHVAVACMGSYMLTNVVGVMVNYDQPLTQHPTNNPNPNIAFGLQMATITHTFQIFVGNYQSILPQLNNMYNQNDYTQSRYLIGFNITKRWLNY
ncbi:MAG: DUF5777 family beta-barrel protein [Bacteroidia bacterium]